MKKFVALVISMVLVLTVFATAVAEDDLLDLEEVRDVFEPIGLENVRLEAYWHRDAGGCTGGAFLATLGGHELRLPLSAEYVRWEGGEESPIYITRQAVLSIMLVLSELEPWQ